MFKPQSWAQSGATPHTQTPLTTPFAEKSWLEEKIDPMTME